MKLFVRKIVPTMANLFFPLLKLKQVFHKPSRQTHASFFPRPSQDRDPDRKIREFAARFRIEQQTCGKKRTGE